MKAAIRRQLPVRRRTIHPLPPRRTPKRISQRPPRFPKRLTRSHRRLRRRRNPRLLRRRRRLNPPNPLALPLLPPRLWNRLWRNLLPKVSPLNSDESLDGWAVVVGAGLDGLRGEILVRSVYRQRLET